VTKGKGHKAKGKGEVTGQVKGKGQGKGAGVTVGSIDELYQLPLSEFTPGRNTLATRLRKSGKAGDADEVRSLVKPSIPAWAVNQVYWKHRPAFDRLLSSGDRLRKADHGVVAAIQRQRFADDRRIGRESLLPHRMRQHDYRRGRRTTVVFSEEAAAQGGLDTED